MTQGDTTQGTGRDFALLFRKARRTLRVCSTGCAQISGPGNCRSSLLTDSDCQGHKTELFLFSSRHTKGVRVGFPQAPSAVSWEHPCHPAGPQSALKRGPMPTETHFQPCKSTGVAQTSSSHLRNTLLKFPRKAAAIPQVTSSSTQGDISPTERFHSP